MGVPIQVSSIDYETDVRVFKCVVTGRWVTDYKVKYEFIELFSGDISGDRKLKIDLSSMLLGLCNELILQIKVSNKINKNYVL
ncbi:MAG: hypothetical protein FJ150_05295 [Euryarchaeota archaeon]|nr:hypothetical protein [Euryarchaeota archaeon]